LTRFTKKVKKKVGLSPGSLVFVGQQKSDKVKISIVDYDHKNLVEKVTANIEDSFEFKDRSNTVTWLNVDGLHDVTLIEKIGINFNIHPLILEDILNTDQRSKIEIYDEYIFIVIKKIGLNNLESKVQTEQFSIILGKTFVLSFQEQTSDFFEPVKERIRKSKGLIRKMNHDYLTYAILDMVVDNYFVILEEYEEHCEKIEDGLITEPNHDLLQQIYSLKREIIILRKSIWPLREAISKLERSDSAFIQKKTLPYIRDLYDHTIHVIDITDTLRELVSGMLDHYLSSMSNKMNEVMKVLTIIATTFIPLTFIVGVYGMNFENIPELKWHYGYLGIWVLMILIGLGMLVYFKRKKWL